MQRIKPDAGRVHLGSQIDERGEIAEIAVAPVGRGANPVKLNRKQPVPLALVPLVSVSAGRFELMTVSRRRWLCCHRVQNAPDSLGMSDLRPALRIDIDDFDAPARGTFQKIIHGVSKAKKPRPRNLLQSRFGNATSQYRRSAPQVRRGSTTQHPNVGPDVEGP